MRFKQLFEDLDPKVEIQNKNTEKPQSCTFYPPKFQDNFMAPNIGF